MITPAKRRITKKPNSRITQNESSFIKLQNQKLKFIKRIEKSCHIPDLTQAVSYVSNVLIKPDFMTS